MTLYERYSGNNTSTSVSTYNSDYLAQTFTVGTISTNENFFAKSGAIRIWKLGSPTDAWLYLQNTNSQGHPSGYLDSGSIAISNVSTDSNGDWYNVSFSKDISLKEDTKYAITLACSGDGSNKLLWTISSNGGYTGGNGEHSSDSGSTWSSWDGDFFFRIYGIKDNSKTTYSDLRIYYSSLASPHYIEGPCLRWNTSNYTITVETILDKYHLNKLRDHTTPGATGELYKILDRPVYYDSTWTGDNTIKLSPVTNSNSNLKSMREDTIIYVKTLTTNPIEGPSGYIHVKIEGYISGS